MHLVRPAEDFDMGGGDLGSFLRSTQSRRAQEAQDCRETREGTVMREMETGGILVARTSPTFSLRT